MSYADDARHRAEDAQRRQWAIDAAQRTAAQEEQRRRDEARRRDEDYRRQQQETRDRLEAEARVRQRQQAEAISQAERQNYDDQARRMQQAADEDYRRHKKRRKLQMPAISNAYRSVRPLAVQGTVLLLTLTAAGALLGVWHGGDKQNVYIGGVIGGSVSLAFQSVRYALFVWVLACLLALLAYRTFRQFHA